MADSYDEELERLEEDLGLNVSGLTDAVAAELDEDDDDEGVEGIVEGDEDTVAAILSSKLPLGKNDPQVRKVARMVVGQANAARRLLAGVAATRMAALNTRPNSAVTLYATSEGQLCAPNNDYPLRPRSKGSLSSSDFRFKETMMFFRFSTERIDASEGFYFAADTVGWRDDKAKSFDFDLNVGVFGPERELKETPLSSLHGRSPRDNTDFTATVRLDKPAVVGNERTCHGATIEFFDSECSKSYGRKWGDAVGSLDFDGLTRALMDRVQKRVKRLRPRKARRITRG
ncbi:MAG TPA: hypothetical protein VLS46_04770 [Gaiellaceae bacterium]|nr:hypothetical protein [Gaiellaceae bacterium]